MLFSGELLNATEIRFAEHFTQNPIVQAPYQACLNPSEDSFQ